MYRALAEALAADTQFTMNDLFDLYDERLMPAKAPKTREGQEIQLRALRAWGGKRSPNDIEPHEIAEYLDTRSSKVGANREIALLSAVFTAGIRWGKAKRNPCLGVARNVETPRKVYVSSPRFWAAWTAAPLQVGLAMELSLTTGQRLGDLLALKWTAIQDNGIHFIQNKTGVSIVIGYTEWLQDVIARCKEQSHKSDYVLVNSQGLRWTTDGFKTAWQRFMKPREDRFQFRDIRKKSGNDGDTGEHLGNDKKTFDKWYAMKPKRASALTGRETPVEF
jgi:integrase